MPGYEPRTLQGMALGLAVNARGADHNRSGAYEADLSGDYDRLAGGDAQVAAAVATEDRAAVMDSMILCKFLRGVFDEPYRGNGGRTAERVAPGGTSTPPSCALTARRIVLAKWMFNLREGWNPGRRLVAGEAAERAGVRLNSGRDAILTATRLREMIDGYYAIRGLDQEGRAASSWRPRRPARG